MRERYGGRDGMVYKDKQEEKDMFLAVYVVDRTSKRGREAKQEKARKEKEEKTYKESNRIQEKRKTKTQPKT